MKTRKDCRKNVNMNALGRFSVRRTVIILAVLFGTIATTQAANKTWTNGGGTGNWSDASNWSGGLPGTGDVAIFGATYKTNCNINTQVSVSGITIQTGYTGIITQGAGDSIIVTSAFSQSAGTFTGGNSVIRIKGSMTITAGTFTSTTNTLYCGTNFTVGTSGVFNHNNGTLYFDLGNATTINFPSGTLNFKNVTFNSTVGKNITTNDTMVINGVLSLLQNQVKGGVIRMVAGSSLVQNAAFTGGTTQLELKAALTINPNTTNFLGLILNHASAIVNAPASSISFNAPVVVNSGTFNGGSNSITMNGDFTQNGGTFTATSGTMNFDKNFTYNAGTFNNNNGNVAFTSASTTNFTTGGKITFRDATLNKNSPYVFVTLGATDTLKTSGTLYLTKGTVNGGYLQALGNDGLSIASGYNGGTSVMLVSAATNLNIAAGVTVPTLILNNVSATVSLSAGTSPTFIGPVTILNGTFDCTSSAWHMSQALNILGGTFTASSDEITYDNELLTISSTATFNHNNGTFSFTKTTGGTTVDNSLKAHFYNLNIVLSDLATQNAKLIVKTGDTLVVENSLTLAAGMLDSGVIELQGELADLGSFNGGNGLFSIANGIGARNISFMSANQPAINIDDANVTAYSSSIQPMTVNGLFNLKNGDFFPDAYPITFASTYTQNGGNFWPGSTKLWMNGDMNLTDGNFYSTSDTLEINGQNITMGATATFDHNYGITFLNSSTNNITISNAPKMEFYDLIVNLDNAADNLSMLNIATGDTIVSAGALTLQAGSLNGGVLQIKSELADQGIFKGGTGTFYFAEGTDVRNLYLMSAEQPNIVIKDTTLSLNTPTDKDVTFTGKFTLIAGEFFPYAYQAHDLTFNSTVTQTGGTFWNGAAKETMLGNLHVSGGTFYATSDVLLLSNATMTVSTPAIFHHNDGTVQFEGATNSILYYDGGALGLNNLDIELTNAELRPTSNLNMDGNLTIGSSSILNMSTSSIDVAIGGDLNDQNLSQGLVYGSRTVTMNGDSDQVIRAASGNESFYKLTVGNTDGGVHTAHTNVYVYNQLTLTPASNGKIFLGSDNITLGASATIIGGSATEFVVTDGSGSLRQENIGATGRSGAVVFPVGNSSIKYSPVTVTNSGTNDRFEVRIGYGIWTNGTNGGQVLNGALNQTYFVEEEHAGGSNVTLQLQWDASHELSGFDRSNCGIRHYTGGAWVHEGIDGIASGSGPYTVSTSGITTFSPFDVGSDGAGGSLPIELASFTGSLNDNGTVTLDWSTSIEINNNYFTVERSTDGVDFMELGREEGAGNSSMATAYNMLDKQPANGMNYYRLKQTDYNGQSKYVGGIVAINTTKAAATTISVYPNPLEGRNVNVSIQNNADQNPTQVDVRDMTGKTVYSNILTASTNNIALPSTLSQGMYMIQVTTGGNIYQQKLLVK